MARPGERGQDKKSDDNLDGKRQNTLTCHDSSQHTTKFAKCIQLYSVSLNFYLNCIYIYL